MFEGFSRSDPSLEEKEIREIGESDLEVSKKRDLALLILGTKDAAWLGNYQIVRKEKDRQEIIDALREESGNVESVLDTLGYPHKTTKEINPDDDILGFGIAVGKNLQKLEEFVEAEKEGDDRTMGLMLGYPKTAVETYNTDASLYFQDFFEQDLEEDEKKKLLDEGVTRFFDFQPSKVHWREELETARENQRLIREKAPKLYQEIMEYDYYLL